MREGGDPEGIPPPPRLQPCPRPGLGERHERCRRAGGAAQPAPLSAAQRCRLTGTPALSRPASAEPSVD